MYAAIYARKSTDQNGVADEAKSVTRQIAHARAYAKTKGWSVSDAHVYVDDGVSGAEFAKRPGFLRVMNSLKPKPPFDVLIMSEESRLGRESIETAYALKQLVQAGVRVFFYLEDRERTLDSPTDKIMLSLTAFADELEREKARQRTYDAMVRKAKAGHVTGGAVFGYRNRDMSGLDGRRSHVKREIDDTQAAVVRRIFELCAKGYGKVAIAKRLNAEAAPAPRAQQGRPNAWAPSSVRAVLYRELYRGEIVWNRTKKRDSWGVKCQRSRPESEWLRVPAPELRIVDEELWNAAHTRLAATRQTYLRTQGGRLWGRPPSGLAGKYLLTGLARCGVCGGGLEVRSRSHGRRRTFFYSCSSFYRRGPEVCPNRYEIPMQAAGHRSDRSTARGAPHAGSSRRCAGTTARSRRGRTGRAGHDPSGRGAAARRGGDGARPADGRGGGGWGCPCARRGDQDARRPTRHPAGTTDDHGATCGEVRSHVGAPPQEGR